MIILLKNRHINKFITTYAAHNPKKVSWNHKELIHSIATTSYNEETKDNDSTDLQVYITWTVRLQPGLWNWSPQVQI